MKLDSARYEGGELILSTTDPEARRVAYKFKAGEYELVRRKPRRSLDANALYWELCGRLARAVNEPPEEVYKRHIRDIGNYDVLCVQDKAVENFAQHWCSGHLGRMVETRASKIARCTTVLAYYGSSDFDKAQMSRLIDNCIQDCRALDIETLPPWQLEGLLSQWEEAAARKPSA